MPDVLTQHYKKNLTLHPVIVEQLLLRSQDDILYDSAELPASSTVMALCPVNQR